MDTIEKAKAAAWIRKAVDGVVSTMRRHPKASLKSTVVFWAFKNRVSTPTQCAEIEQMAQTELNGGR
jgi:hypothetical protein